MARAARARAAAGDKRAGGPATVRGLRGVRRPLVPSCSPVAMSALRDGGGSVGVSSRGLAYSPWPSSAPVAAQRFGAVALGTSFRQLCVFADEVFLLWFTFLSGVPEGFSCCQRWCLFQQRRGVGVSRLG